MQVDSVIQSFNRIETYQVITLELTREVITTKHSQLCVSESRLEKTNEFFFQVKQ